MVEKTRRSPQPDPSPQEKGEKPYHALPLESLFSQLKTSKKGLSSAEAQKRLSEWGRNEIVQLKKETALDSFLRQFRSLPIIMLLAAAFISLLLGITYDDTKLIDAVAIFIAVMIAVCFSFFQEYKAERALEALKRMVVLRSLS
jgi:Ca2+-transporting ATPase